MPSRPSRSSRRWCWSTTRGCRCSRSPTPSGKSYARWAGNSGRTFMTFAGINYLAVLVAGAIGFAFGGVWYRLLAEPWKAAHGFSSEQIRAHHGTVMAPWPLVIALAADLIMAWMLPHVIGHLGDVTIKNGVISAAFIWFGFVVTPLGVNKT